MAKVYGEPNFFAQTAFLGIEVCIADYSGRDKMRGLRTDEEFMIARPFIRVLNPRILKES
jgi:hypothetical protein